MSSTKILAANWKMNLLKAEASSLAQASVALSQRLKHTQIWLAPSFTLLSAVAEKVEGSGVRLGAQNVYWEESGAFTGEVSAAQLLDSGCRFAIVGHSERRHKFGESCDAAARRGVAALSSGLDAIFCIGETLDERIARKTFSVLEAQLSPFVELLAAASTPRAAITLAYEPVWAIGTGKAAALTDIAESHGFLVEWWRKNAGSSAPAILYGGSVSPENFFSILTVPHVAGALVGKASLDAKSLTLLAQAAEQAGQ